MNRVSISFKRTVVRYADCDRRHLVKIPESVKDNDKITSETSPDNSSKSDNENKDIPDNRSDQTDYYVTRSGRISKPPDKLNL